MQGIRRRCRRHKSKGNKHRPSLSPFSLPEIAAAVALPLRCCCLRLCCRRRLEDERPAIVAAVRCPHLSPVSHHRSQGRSRYCRLAVRNLRCCTASVKDVDVDVMMSGLIPFLLCPLLQALCGRAVNSFGVNGSGGRQKIKAQPPLHKRCEGEGKNYNSS